jgi:hypothetical protein
MKKRLLILFPFLLLQMSVNAQDSKIGRHTVAEWRHIIDTTWGEGQTTEQKLQIFDNFWNAIDQRYAGFEGIEDNWQQLKSWRDTIAQGVSRGRFAGILEYMAFTLHDGHVYMWDKIVGSTTLDKDVPVIVPIGIEEVVINPKSVNHFGAALTPLPDSTLLVYNSVDNHPLGIVPGDIVLGYDGRLWKDIFRDLVEVQFPMSDFLETSCSDEAATYQWLQAAGMNWHLFDTIDVVKYNTGDTVHLSTSVMTNSLPEIHATDQMPIGGVAFPDAKHGHHVSWGYVEGTHIGYIYFWGSWTNFDYEDFLNAVNSFMPDSSSDGIIIDARKFEGAGEPASDKGFKRLFNQNVDVMQMLERASKSDHLSMKPHANYSLSGVDAQVYDRPIAVLSGPWAISGGDFFVQILRQHPMTRVFGKPTNGAFGACYTNDIPGIPDDWFNGLTVVVGYTPPDYNDRLYRKSVPVDEEVWLTPDRVAKGEDDVVNAALNWINNLVYGHSFTKNTGYFQPGIDTLKISAQVENPNYHQTSSKIYIKSLEGSFIDSLELNKTGLSDKSEIWSGNYSAPDSEDIFNISLTAKDITGSKTWTMNNISRFTTIGPVVLDSISIQYLTGSYTVKPFLKNKSKSATLKNVSVELTSEDPWISSISLWVNNVSNINPGTSIGASTFQIQYVDSLFPGYFNLKFEIMSDGWTYWIDSTKVIVTGINDKITEPLTFNLEQNYPNPFNPKTKIKYSVPYQSLVTLKIFDILGREIQTLINEEKTAGIYEIDFDASQLSSGIYFYQIKAIPNRRQGREFKQTKKMILVK